MPRELDIASVLSAWPIGTVHSIAWLTSGSNNDNWLIEAARGAFVLRIYRNIDAASHTAFEHALLAAVAAADPPFAVPLPLPTSSGATMVAVGSGVASLACRISGRHPRSGNVADTRAAGAGLGVLDRVLAGIPGNHLPPCPSSGYGDLRAVHPAVTSPEDVIMYLGLTGSGSCEV